MLGFVFGFFATGLLCEAAQCGLSVSRLQYQDGSGRHIDYDFSSGEITTNASGDQDEIELPGSAVLGRGAGEEGVTFLWEEVGGSERDTDAMLTNDALSIRIEQAQWVADTFQGWWAIGAYNGPVAPTPSNWTFEVRLDDFSGLDKEHHFLEIDMGGGGWDVVWSPGIAATWFTGWSEGTHYDNLLILSADIWNDEADEGVWEGDEQFLLGNNPTSTVLDLKLVITDGVTLAASYRLNDGAWESLGGHTLTEGTMPGFAGLFPYLDIESGLHIEDDGDEMPPDWELQYGLNPVTNDASADVDSDGYSNLKEYISGTNPTNATSFFCVTNNFQQGGGFVVQWNAISNRHYSVLRSTNLMSGFRALETEIEYPQNSYTDTVSGVEAKGFYKVDVQLK